MNLIAWMMAYLGRKPLSQVLTDEHHQASLELIEAEAQVTHWTAKRDALRQRVPTLETQIKSAKGKELKAKAPSLAGA
jgi:hypothetical protein